MNLLAQGIKLYDKGGFFGWGPLGLEGRSATEAPTIFATVISITIGILTIVAIIWFVFVFLTGAIGFITSGGDKSGIESSKKKIATGVIGLVVTTMGLLIIRLIGALFGLGNILDFAKMFSSLSNF